MSEQLVRFECWDGTGWRGSGRLDLPEETPAEMTGEAVRRLAACGLLKAGGSFRLWVPGANGWRAEGEVGTGELALAARLSEAKAEGGGRKAEGRMHCMVPGCLVALMPSLEPHWSAWFLLGATFGMGAYLLYRLGCWLEAELGQDKGAAREFSRREEAEISAKRQRARVLTESEQRELLLTALADAMRTPMRRVDIRGVPALWALSEAQKAVWLAWLRGKELEWAGLRWVAGVERHEHLVFVKFALQEWRKGPRHEGTEALSMTTVEPRKVTERVVVARANAWSTVAQREDARS